MNPKKAVGVGLILLLALPILLHILFAVVPGMNSYVVATDSMGPAIQAGSIVYVADTGNYEVGDVVTFKRDGKAVTHRIVEVNSDSYVTKGDANDSPDAPITEDQIVGEVVLSIPLYGYFFVFASSPIGYGLLIVFPGLLLIWSLFRE